MKRLLRALLRAILIVLGIVFAWLTLAKLVRRFFRFPAPSFFGRFLDSDWRRMLQPPDQIIRRSGIHPGMKVLEIGCGSGAYTTFVARRVGEKGEVAALDIQADMLAQLEKKLNQPEHRDVHNVRLYEASAYELPFDAASFDLVYMITVLPEIPDPARALAEVRRVLRPGGILAVSEFLPDPDYPLWSTTVSQGEAAGLGVEGVDGNLWTYTVRFRKPVILLETSEV
jgi:SAM-dependent methyltransferase